MKIDLLPEPKVDVAALTTDRMSIHGEWGYQAKTAQQLKTVSRARTDGESRLSVPQIEAIEMILVKISRILNGDPDYADHWIDIMGYAHLGKTGHNG